MWVIRKNVPLVDRADAARRRSLDNSRGKTCEPQLDGPASAREKDAHTR